MADQKPDKQAQPATEDERRKGAQRKTMQVRSGGSHIVKEGGKP